MSLHRLWCWWSALMVDAPSTPRRNGVGWISLDTVPLLVRILKGSVMYQYGNPYQPTGIFEALSEVSDTLPNGFSWTVPFYILRGNLKGIHARSFSVDDSSLKISRLESTEIIWIHREFGIFVLFFPLHEALRLELIASNRLFGWSNPPFSSPESLPPAFFGSCPRKSTKSPTRCWTPLRGWSCFMWIMERKRCGSRKNGEFSLELLEICGKPVRFWIVEKIQHWYVLYDVICQLCSVLSRGRSFPW